MRLKTEVNDQTHVLHSGPRGPISLLYGTRNSRMTVSLSNPRAKQRWTLLAAGVAALILLVAGLAQGFTQTNWELDKNATNTLTSTHLGGLKSSVTTTTATSITVCELAGVPTAPFEIQIDAER